MRVEHWCRPLTWCRYGGVLVTCTLWSSRVQELDWPGCSPHLSSINNVWNTTTEESQRSEAFSPPAAALTFSPQWADSVFRFQEHFNKLQIPPQTKSPRSKSTVRRQTQNQHLPPKPVSGSSGSVSTSEQPCRHDDFVEERSKSGWNEGSVGVRRTTMFENMFLTDVSENEHSELQFNAALSQASTHHSLNTRRKDRKGFWMIWETKELKRKRKV